MKIERHPDYCKELAHHGRMGLAQCTRRPKRDGYCAQHHPEAKAAREAASRKAWDEQAKRRRNFEVAWGLSQATDAQLLAEVSRRGLKP